MTKPKFKVQGSRFKVKAGQLFMFSNELQVHEQPQKSFPQNRFCLLDQGIVEEAPSPAKYSRGRLFSMIFAEDF
jgi:hypothetical protein